MGERIFVRGARTPLEGPQCLDDALAGRIAVQLPGEVACHRGGRSPGPLGVKREQCRDPGRGPGGDGYLGSAIGVAAVANP
eukprot:3862560-Alexandrium_andersonii.AAC.1